MLLFFFRIHGVAEDFIISLGKNLKLNSSLKALNLAKQMTRKRTKKFGDIKVSLSHPYFWAPFVYIGD